MAYRSQAVDVTHNKLKLRRVCNTPFPAAMMLWMMTFVRGN